MEIKDWQTFITALILFVVGAVVIVLLLPIQDSTHTRLVYDFALKKTVPEPTINLTGIWLILIWGLLCLFYLASASTPSNVTRIRTWREIERDWDVQDLLADHHITAYSPRQHDEIIGQYSIGYLKYIERIGTHGKIVSMVAIGNHDHKTTKTRAQFPCAIIAATQHQYELSKMISHLVPSERASLESQLERILKAYEKKSEPIKELILGNAQEKIKEQETEPS